MCSSKGYVRASGHKMALWWSIHGNNTLVYGKPKWTTIAAK